jgi:hypothetical protein
MNNTLNVTFNFNTECFELHDLNDRFVSTLKSTNLVDAREEAVDIMLVTQWEIDNADIGSEFDL